MNSQVPSTTAGWSVPPSSDIQITQAITLIEGQHLNERNAIRGWEPKFRARTKAQFKKKNTIVTYKQLQLDNMIILDMCFA